MFAFLQPIRISLNCSNLLGNCLFMICSFKSMLNLTCWWSTSNLVIPADWCVDFQTATIFFEMCVFSTLCPVCLSVFVISLCLSVLCLFVCPYSVLCVFVFVCVCLSTLHFVSFCLSILYVVSVCLSILCIMFVCLVCSYSVLFLFSVCLSILCVVCQFTLFCR